MVREVPLTQGLVALIDDEDYERVSQHRWYPLRKRHTTYAITKVVVNGKKRSALMHGLVTGYAFTDHRDGDGLNNRRSNLREATNAENSWHRVNRRRNTTSGFYGVTKTKTPPPRSLDRWTVAIGVDRKSIFIGSFDNPLDAVLARDQAAMVHHGEFASLNFSRNFHASLQATLAAFEAAA